MLPPCSPPIHATPSGAGEKRSSSQNGLSSSVTASAVFVVGRVGMVCSTGLVRLRRWWMTRRCALADGEKDENISGAGRGCPGVARYLVRARWRLMSRASFILQASDGRTALMTAAQVGQERVVELLLQRGAEIDLQDSDGGTARPPTRATSGLSSCCFSVGRRSTCRRAKAAPR